MNKRKKSSSSKSKSSSSSSKSKSSSGSSRSSSRSSGPVTVSSRRSGKSYDGGKTWSGGSSSGSSSSGSSSYNAPPSNKAKGLTVKNGNRTSFFSDAYIRRHPEQFQGSGYVPSARKFTPVSGATAQQNKNLRLYGSSNPIISKGGVVDGKQYTGQQMLNKRATGDYNINPMSTTNPRSKYYNPGFVSGDYYSTTPVYRPIEQGGKAVPTRQMSTAERYTQANAGKSSGASTLPEFSVKKVGTDTFSPLQVTTPTTQGESAFDTVDKFGEYVGVAPLAKDDDDIEKIFEGIPEYDKLFKTIWDDRDEQIKNINKEKKTEADLIKEGFDKYEKALTGQYDLQAGNQQQQVRRADVAAQAAKAALNNSKAQSLKFLANKLGASGAIGSVGAIQAALAEQASDVQSEMAQIDMNAQNQIADLITEYNGIKSKIMQQIGQAGLDETKAMGELQRWATTQYNNILQTASNQYINTYTKAFDIYESRRMRDEDRANQLRDAKMEVDAKSILTGKMNPAEVNELLAAETDPDKQAYLRSIVAQQESSLAQMAQGMAAEVGAILSTEALQALIGEALDPSRRVGGTEGMSPADYIMLKQDWMANTPEMGLGQRTMEGQKFDMDKWYKQAQLNASRSGGAANKKIREITTDIQTGVNDNGDPVYKEVTYIYDELTNQPISKFVDGGYVDLVESDQEAAYQAIFDKEQAGELPPAQELPQVLPQVVPGNTYSSNFSGDQQINIPLSQWSSIIAQREQEEAQEEARQVEIARINKIREQQLIDSYGAGLAG